MKNQHFTPNSCIGLANERLLHTIINTKDENE